MPVAVFSPIGIGLNRRPRHTTPPQLDIGGLAHGLAGAILQRRVPYLLKAPLEAVWGMDIGSLFTIAAISSPILLDNWWSIPLAQTLANAAKWSSLARSDVELGLFDRASSF
jgi:hypothetical protein